jgi:mannose-6-phosphate isomerase-like protein (cupin superfamily)
MIESEAREAVVDRGAGTAYWFGDAQMTIKARGGRNGVTLIEWISPAGGNAPLHIHDDLDDNFFILDGSLAIWCDGRTSHAGVGSYVMLPQGVPHSVQVDADGPLRAMLVHANERFADFIEAAGTPAAGRATPPSFDPQRFTAIASANGVEVLGPPPFS